MSKKIEDITEGMLREVFTESGLTPDLTEKAIEDYKRYRESELSILSILSHKEITTLGAEGLGREIDKFRSGGEVVIDILKKYLRYVNYKKDIAETYQESKDWEVVFSNCVYSDVSEAQESFIDYIEETYQTKVKDVKHLQKLTGITHLDSWDSKTKEYVTPDTEEEAKENAIRELEETLINSKYSKYYRALEKALEERAKYKDLLSIKPQDYGLGKSWSGCISSDQYSSIIWAISRVFLLSEGNGGLMLLPDLRSISNDLEAPYSVLMDAYKISNKWKV